MTSVGTIDYETLAQDAMRGVVRAVLTEVAKTGLPGDHHFYISFDTLVGGATLSKRLKEKYPEEMTIVLQHRFWDLIVTEDRFEVKLTFDGIPERLIVPFRSIRVFFDPSVRYGLQFEEPSFGAEPGGDPGSMPADAASRALIVSMGQDAGRANGRPRSTADRKPRTTRKPKLEKVAGPSQDIAPTTKTDRAPQPAPAARTIEGASDASVSTAETGEKSSGLRSVPVETPKDAGSSAQILSLDQFRKK